MYKKKNIEVDKKAKDKAPEKGKRNIGFTVKSLIIPFILAAIVACLIYLVMTNITKNEVVKAHVVCATKDIEANTFIAEDKVDDYFEIKDVEKAILPDCIYSEITELPDGGFYVESDLSARQMVNKDDIAEKDSVMDKYTAETQVTSIKVNDFNNSVSGTIRHGDIVNVYAKDPSTNQLVLMVENVYVEAAYDNSGNELTKSYEAENGTATAVVFSVKVAPDEVDQMNTAISYEGIQLYLAGK